MTIVQPIAPEPIANVIISGLISGYIGINGATIAVAPIIATVADPTAACRIIATSQANKIGCISKLERITANESLKPLPFKMPLNAPPAPIINKILAIELKLSSVFFNRVLMPILRRIPKI